MGKRCRSFVHTVLVGLVILPVGLLAEVDAVWAQDSPEAESHSALRDALIKTPTGRNGYEELLLAGEILGSSQVFQNYDLSDSLARVPLQGVKLPDEAQRRFREAQEATTLSSKRRVLRDSQVARCLALLRQGLSKPAFVPPGATLDDLSDLRWSLHRLSYLMQLQECVLLADGQVSESIVWAGLWMRLGQVEKTGGLSSCSMGVGITARCAAFLGAHLEQFGARDCERLLQICRERLRQPAPILYLLEGERGLTRRSLEEIRAGVQRKGIAYLQEDLNLPDDPQDDNETDVEERRFLANVKQVQEASPAAVDALFRQAEKRADDLFDRALAEAKKPAWERSHADPLRLEDLAEHLLSHTPTYVPILSWMIDRMTTEEAYIRLLACHCAIRRYKWEHDRLPESLAELKLGDLAIDPFLGQPLRYEVRGDKSRLISAGPRSDGEDPKAVNGRHPLSLIRGDP